MTPSHTGNSFPQKILIEKGVQTSMANQTTANQPPVKNKGWLVTLSATMALLALGVLFSWSVIKQNIPAEWGWLGWQKTLPYSMAVVVFSVMTVLGGRLQDRFGPRLVVTLGGIFSGIGMILSSLTTSPWVFALSFGVLLGTGIGFVYASGTPTSIKWFPAKKTGLITGIVLAGFGLGSAWVAPVSKSLIASYGLQASIFWLGVGMLVVIVGFAQFLSAPPAGYQPAGSTPVKKTALPSNVDYTPKEVVKTWQYYALWVAFALSAGAALMIIGNLALIVGDQAGLSEFSALAVTVLAFGNGSGRVAAGALSDKFGRQRILMISFLLQAVVIVLLSQAVQGSVLATVPLMGLLSFMVGVNYGSIMSVFPALTKDFFGLKNFGMIYGLVYTAWGLGGFLLSQLAGVIKDATATFMFAYYLSAGLLIIAAIIMYAIKSPQETKRYLEPSFSTPEKAV